MIIILINHLNITGIHHHNPPTNNFLLFNSNLNHIHIVNHNFIHLTHQFVHHLITITVFS